MKTKHPPKPLYLERLKLLLKDNNDLNSFLDYIKTEPKKSIRVNTLRITPEDLIKRLENKGWEILQIDKENSPEILQIQNKLEPGVVGKTKEHILGYYYVQEITSMMPILALDPKPDELILDLCAAPGSKTSGIASKMENIGTIIANDLSVGRIKILSSNLERLGITNTVITRDKGEILCEKLKNLKYQFDKILVDAPCSGEGNCRTSPRTFLEWSPGLLKSLSKKQKKLIQKAFELLKPNGTLIYSTCTYSPEENETVINHFLENNKNAKIEPIENLPIKTRKGILKWKEKEFHKDLINAKRIYHHDNDLEGFFLCKIKKLPITN